MLFDRSCQMGARGPFDMPCQIGPGGVHLTAAVQRRTGSPGQPRDQSRASPGSHRGGRNSYWECRGGLRGGLRAAVCRTGGASGGRKYTGMPGAGGRRTRRRTGEPAADGEPLHARGGGQLYEGRENRENHQCTLRKYRHKC